ncbi:hypothetical protein LTR70_003746 [Exophiala xenobiotica]|nr:hypothetical protein LTR70_003746 [Exophiala xenobiotica]
MPLSSTIPNPMPSPGSAAYLLAKAKFESLPNAQLPRARVRSMPGFVPLPLPTDAAKAVFESQPNVFVWEFKSHWSITRGGKAILLRGPLDTLDQIYAGFDTNEELGHYRDKTQARSTFSTTNTFSSQLQPPPPIPLTFDMGQMRRLEDCVIEKNIGLEAQKAPQ